MKKTIKVSAIILFVLAVIGSIGKRLEKNEEAITKPINDSINLVLRQDSIKQAQKDSIENVAFLKTKAGKVYKKHPEWDKLTCQYISENRIWIGMSYEMLIYERGRPNRLNTSNYGRGNEYQACWDDYNPSCFYFGENQIIKSYN